MSWKKVGGARLAAYYLPETRMMRTDEDEEEFIVVPEEVPSAVPEKAPAPVQEPAREPQKVGWKKVTEDAVDISKKPKMVSGEFIGYRHGQAAKRDGQWILHSPVKPMPWERGHVTAKCEAGRDHEAPQKDCSCGLYATWDEGELTQEHGDDSEWTTQVKAWGRVVTGANRPRVMRAQHMQITGIRPPKCEQCDTPATHLISANEQALSGRPTCEDHRPESISGGKIKVTATPIDEVCKHLSDYYGGAEVRHHGETWGSNEMSEFEKDVGKTSSALGQWGKITGTWARVGLMLPKVAASPFRKEFKDVRNHAEGLGWTIQETTKGWMFKAPKESVRPGYKGLVVTHGSPSDHRAFKNFLGDLKNEGGLVWPPERARQRKQKQERLDHDPGECLVGRGFDTSGLEGDDLVEFHQMAHDDRG